MSKIQQYGIEKWKVVAVRGSAGERWDICERERVGSFGTPHSTLKWEVCMCKYIYSSMYILRTNVYRKREDRSL